MTLTSSKDFGATLKEKSDTDYRRLRENFDAFISRPLELWMFVAVDQNGNVLSEPQMIEKRLGFDEVEMDYDYAEVEVYKKALERVLFEGYSAIVTNNQVVTLVNSFHRILFTSYKNGATYFIVTDYSEEDLPETYALKIESLVEFDVTLTPTAIKEIEI